MKSIKILLFTPLLLTIIVFSENVNAMRVGVNYEGPYDWSYYLSEIEIRQDFQLFKDNNINFIIVNVIWSPFQTGINPTTYNQANINNVKRVLNLAEEYEINVSLSFFQYFQDTSTGVPSWCIDPSTGQKRFIAIVRNRTIRGYFLEMIGDLVDEFKYSPAIERWSLLNEPMHIGTPYPNLATEREEFHLLIEEGVNVIRQRDGRPISVRFTLPYSPWHTRTSGAYDTFVDFDRVMQSLDFMSLNIYGDTCDDNDEWEGVNWNIFNQAVADTKGAGHELWVTEFGCCNPAVTDEIQRRHYECAMTRFSNLDVDTACAWAWIHNDGGETFNCCRVGGDPRPAFYELNNYGLAFSTTTSTTTSTTSTSTTTTTVIPSGIVGYWNFDDCTARDYSDYKNDGVVSGANCIGGKIGSGLEFDGIDDYAQINDDESLDLTDELTISAWIYPRSFGESGFGRIVDKNFYGAYSFYVRSATPNGITFGAGGTSYQSNSNIITLNNWQHVVVTFNRSASSNQIKFYVNAVQKGSGTLTASIPVTSDNLYIGNSADQSRTFDGMIDEIKIWNRTLSEEEIETEYNRHAPAITSTSTTTSRPTTTRGGGGGGGGCIFCRAVMWGLTGDQLIPIVLIAAIAIVAAIYFVFKVMAKNES